MENYCQSGCFCLLLCLTFQGARACGSAEWEGPPHNATFKGERDYDIHYCTNEEEICGWFGGEAVYWVSKTMHGSGVATVDVMNSHVSGKVNLYHNGIRKISLGPHKRERVPVLFNHGDVLKVDETGIAVLRVYGITVSCSDATNTFIKKNTTSITSMTTEIRITSMTTERNLISILVVVSFAAILIVANFQRALAEQRKALAEQRKALEEQQKVISRLERCMEDQQGVNRASAEQREALEEQRQVISRLERCMEDQQGVIKRLDEKPAFFTLAKVTEEPATVDDAEMALVRFVTSFASKYGALVSERNAFIQKHRSTASLNERPSSSRLNDIQWTGARYWTAPHTLPVIVNNVQLELGLFSMLAKINRDDDGRLLTAGGMTLQKAINSLVVNRKSCPVFPYPWNHATYRGSNIDPAALFFWRKLMEKPLEDRVYRIPAPLASSVSPDTVQEFFENPQRPGLIKVLFILRWLNESDDQGQPLTPCYHAKYIDGDSACQGEQEILLAAYSAVQLNAFQDADGSTPVTITIAVLRDNRKVPEHLPLAFWH